MKTFETEKHSIPKGATHYCNETCSGFFAWWNDDTKEMLCPDGLVSSWFRVSDLSDVIMYEIPKPRTKTEFVKCEFECAWHAIKAFEDGEELYTKRSHKDFVLIDNAPDVLRFLYDLHRKVEIEIDERQEFIDTAVELLNRGDHGGGASYYEVWFGAMFDSGKFKLVE